MVGLTLLISSLLPKKNKEWKFVSDDKNNFLSDSTFAIEWLVLNVHVCTLHLVMRIVVSVNVYFFTLSRNMIERYVNEEFKVADTDFSSCKYIWNLITNKSNLLLVIFSKINSFMNNVFSLKKTKNLCQKR